MESDLRLVLGDFVLMSLPEAVLVLDGNGAIVESNRAARARGEIAKLFDGTTKDALVDEFLADLRTHGVAKAEVGSIAGLIGLEGTAVEGCFVVIARNLTERREVDQELQLLRSGASLGLVAATLVHDFNNVLTPVLLLSSRLASELEEKSREAMMAYEIHSAATLGASLMRDVLSLSRPRAQLIERVDLNEVIRERLGLIGRLLGEHIELEDSLDDEVGDVLVDRKRFEHALLNLVANARFAMPAGGSLRIATQSAGGDTEPWVTMTVTDTGVGMTDEVRRRAFDSYFTTRPHTGGTGIGLASVHRFARESGGRVTLDSKPLKGTTATLYLPRLAVSERAPISSVERVESPPGHAKVLVADGNDGVSRAIRIALEARGYTVIVASSPESALEMATLHRPEIAIVDTQLAHHDQRTFLHSLRAASGPVRILFLSVPPSVASGTPLPVRYLPKAFSDEELVLAVSEALAATN
jgi:signal transduction histidine kinase